MGTGDLSCARFYVGVNQSLSFELGEFNSTDTSSSLTRFYGHADYQVYRKSPDRNEGLTLFLTFGRK